jgi:hypothetical protein
LGKSIKAGVGWRYLPETVGDRSAQDPCSNTPCAGWAEQRPQAGEIAPDSDSDSFFFGEGSPKRVRRPVMRCAELTLSGKAPLQASRRPQVLLPRTRVPPLRRERNAPSASDESWPAAFPALTMFFLCGLLIPISAFFEHNTFALSHPSGLPRWFYIVWLSGRGFSDSKF